MDQYAQLGLRTLCLGWRELKDDEYKDWSQAFKEANSTLVNREVGHSGFLLNLHDIQESKCVASSLFSGSWMKFAKD